MFPWFYNTTRINSQFESIVLCCDFWHLIHSKQSLARWWLGIGSSVLIPYITAPLSDLLCETKQGEGYSISFHFWIDRSNNKLCNSVACLWIQGIWPYGITMITTQQYMLIYCFASQIMRRVVMKSTDTEVRNLDTAIPQIGRLVITAH